MSTEFLILTILKNEISKAIAIEKACFPPHEVLEAQYVKSLANEAVDLFIVVLGAMSVSLAALGLLALGYLL